MVHSYNGVLVSSTKAKSSDTGNSMDELQKHYAKGKKPETKDHILYHTVYMKSWKRHREHITSVVVRS